MEIINKTTYFDKTKKLFSARKKLILFAFIALFLISVIFNILFLAKLKNNQINRSIVIKPEVKILPEMKEAPDKVKKLITLPQDEQPQVFTITANTPRNQEFIKEAKNGDVLLIYLNNKKAILFDPVKNQILKIGPLTFSTVSGELHKKKSIN